MLFHLTLAVSLLIPKLVVGVHIPRDYDSYNYYVVEHRGPSLDDVANALGVEPVQELGTGLFEGTWLLKVPKPVDSDLDRRGEVLEQRDPVLEKYQELRLRASNHLATRSEEDLRAREIFDSIALLERQELHQRYKRAPLLIQPSSSSLDSVKQRFGINDPLFKDQWHLVNEANPEHTMNVVPVWEMGFTGKGVTAAVIDDGLDYTSKDLKDNFDAENSYDFNDHVALPFPKNANDRHGTRCAGQIAAGKNDQCGIGIAHDAKIAGIRILSKPISDVDEVAALNYGYQKIDVYSCSWGPPDNGKAMAAPSYLISKAVLNGINNGRGGKGSIFVFASGNGAHHGDQCNFDGYTNSIYSVTVSAVDHLGQHPFYSEACAANMITAYSSGSGKHIVTTDKGESQCTDHHGGTSAAAPNVAGVFTLAVQARPELTWRDVQYLCIETAKMINADDPDWDTTATGRKYSNKYGFGVLDAHKFVVAAQNWTLVKPQAWFFSDAIQLDNGTMNEAKNFTGGTPIPSGGLTSNLTITQDLLGKNNFETLEHINIQVWIEHTRRGDVEVEVVSPNGVKSVLAQKRSGDESKNGFPGWVFMSVKHWGENPVGVWTIKVSDQNSTSQSGKFLGWRMKFWGTAVDPSKAQQKYVLPVVDNVLPPSSDPYRPAIDVPTTTTEHSKPTAFLPIATGVHTGNSDAIDFVVEATHVVESHKTLAGGIVICSLLAFIGSIIFFRHRRQQQMKNYSALPADTHPMNQLGEGYGAEPTTIVNSAGRHPQDRVSVGLGFHSSFLDDDDLSTAATPHQNKYHDEPEDGTVPPRSSKVIPAFTMKLLPYALVIALFHNSVLAITPAKRSYATHNYYVLEHDTSTGTPLNEITTALGVEIVELVGELANTWLVRTLKPDLTSRSNDPQNDPVLANYDSFRRRAADADANHRELRSEDVIQARAIVRSTKFLQRQKLRQREKRAPPPLLPSADVAARFGIMDPMFSQQWHLVNDEYPEHMMNVTPVWEMGFTGKGVISSLVDDGLDYTSVDLRDNFDADNSYDFNDHEPLPTPKKWDDHHGTRCAGQVAAVKNNACGVGIAYESKVAGVRILSGPISDVDEAAALNYGFQNVSIYSCSWGPPDNGQAMEGPDYLIKKAVVNGINNGRAGKGSIFVFASGNGAASGDQCNFDGYTNSIYSVTVSAVDYKGLHPYYSEPCAANMIVAYSSGSGKHIVTTDKGENECTKSHGGTSAAAPNAVGVFALALEARAITQEMLEANNFETLEHINIKVWIEHTTRGDVEVELVSPNGIRSILAKRRVGDRASSGFPGWKFMSVKHWGENPIGDWTIRVSDQELPESNGTFLGWNLKFWGTTIDPAKALKFEVPLVENVLPVHIETPVFPTPSPTSTKVLTKPTAHLPDDHGTAPGENTSPAFSSALPDPTSSSIPNGDLGWFPSLSNLVASQKWFFGAIGVVALFGIGMGVFFWRRRKARLTQYNALPGGDDVSMSALTPNQRGTLATGNRPTRELYDAFGELSDDDDDIHEGTALRGNQALEQRGLGFHSAFLDDDEPSTAGGPPTSKYHDEPSPEHTRIESPDRADSPNGSGGSWEHAS
ncbi:hypothetical protein H0H93_011743 [Arthromyces matolae]|nr:hypothetical protein H0H93_011743 [Arthromyces matolae]